MSQRRGFSKGEEWNAAYYLGLEQVVTQGFQGDFDSQVALGFRLLAAAGYETAQVYPGVSEACQRVGEEHQKACREITAGSFDAVRRAREALLWLRDMVPNVSTAWLSKVLSAYDAAHTGGNPGQDRRVPPPPSGPGASRCPSLSGGEPRSEPCAAANCSSTEELAAGLSTGATVDL
jgi:hypothetical protein